MYPYGKIWGRERKLNRCGEYDYSAPGFYFITICTQGMKEWLGRVQGGRMILNKYGGIVKRQWRWLERQYPYIRLEEFVIMPNHMHGILVIDYDDCVGVGTTPVGTTPVGTTPVGTTLGLSLQEDPAPSQKPIYYRQKNLLSKTICAFKTTSSKLIHRAGLLEFHWQRSFYDRVIDEDDEYALESVCSYIRMNPRQWGSDKNNPDNLPSLPKN